MISGTIFIIGLLIAAFLTWRGIAQGFAGKPKTWFIVGSVVVGTALVAIFQPFAIERIDAGHIGLKMKMVGNDQGVNDYEYKSGWCLYFSWTEKVFEFPTYQRHVEYDDQSVITKGGFSATIKPTFNYAPIPTKVGDMFVNLRKPLEEVEQGWLKNAIVGSVNDVANRWSVDSIFNHREQFESNIIAECNKRVSEWFTVSQLRTNIQPPPALAQSIAAKTNAIQEVQVAESKQAVAVADAQRKIAVARGDSADQVIRARAKAKSIELEQAQLSALYIEYLKWKAWDGKLPSTMAGDNTMMMLK